MITLHFYTKLKIRFDIYFTPTPIFKEIAFIFFQATFMEDEPFLNVNVNYLLNNVDWLLAAHHHVVKREHVFAFQVHHHVSQRLTLRLLYRFL